ncbi:MAG: carbohydrate ABC transporter permease [Anaerolineae bacterium]|nr:carbohydrate ABC transporter permease [Anaerolineae bacterium]
MTWDSHEAETRFSLSRWLPRRWYLHLVLIAGALVMIAPLLWMLTLSLKPARLTYSPPYLIPTTFEWSNYVQAWEAAPFARYYLNTAIMAGGVTLGQLLLGSLAAYAFARLTFPGRNLLFLAVLGTMMLPFQVLLIPSYLIVKDLGWLNSFSGLIIPRMVSAFGIFLLRQHYLSIPKELDEAALIDGASRFGVWWRIILPLSRPALATLAIFAFLFAWNDFLWPLIVTDKPDMRTIQLGLVMFQGRYGTNWTLLMAGTVTATVPTIIAFLLGQRQFIESIALSGVKE